MAKIFTVVLAVFIFQAAVQAADKIRIGMPPDAGHFTFPLAQKSGFLKDEGFDAEIISLVGPVANVALTNGDIDYFTGFGSGMQAILRGLPARVVACYRPFPHFVLMARPEFKTIKELNGKTIGVNNFGGGPDLVGRLMIKNFGLDPEKSVKFVAGGSNEGRLVRMTQGLLDATVASFLWDFHGKKMGFNVLARSEDLFTYPISGVIAQTKKIKEKPNEVKRLIRAGIKANRYMRENREGTVQALISTYKLDRELAFATYDSFVKGFNNDGNLPEDGFRRLIEDTKKVTKVDREIALSEVADLSILERRKKSLGSR